MGCRAGAAYPMRGGARAPDISPPFVCPQSGHARGVLAGSLCCTAASGAWRPCLVLDHGQAQGSLDRAGVACGPVLVNLVLGVVVDVLPGVGPVDDLLEARCSPPRACRADTCGKKVRRFRQLQSTQIPFFCPKDPSTKLSDMKRQFLANCPSEVLTPPTLRSLRLISLAAIKRQSRSISGHRGNTA